MPNAYFSYPYIATYFANRGDCSAAVSQCSANYGACTSQLAGQGGFGVTIVVPGGDGTTITNGGQANVGPTSASSICMHISVTRQRSYSSYSRLLTQHVCIGSSLSSVACSGLQPSMCTMTGTTAGGFFFGKDNMAARPTAACFGAMAAGVAGLAVMNGF